MMKMEENQRESILPPTPPLADTETPPVSQLSQPPFRSWWKVGGLVMVTLLLAGGIFFAGYQYAKKQTPPIAQPTPTPVVVVTPTLNPTTNWETYTSPKGYLVKYPPQFFLETRIKGFSVLLEDQQNEQSVAFYLDDRGEKTLAERKEEIKKNLVNPTFSDFTTPGLKGFVATGTVGPGFGEGIYTKAAYIDLNGLDGKELILGCEGKFCKSELFDQILSTFQFLD